MGRGHRDTGTLSHHRATMTVMTTTTALTNPTPELREIRNIDLRRAVLGVLLRAGRPMSIEQIVGELRSQGVEASSSGRSDRKRLGDLLGYQTRLGRVRRVGRGRYEIVADSLSRSARWRSLNWWRVSGVRRR